MKILFLNFLLWVLLSFKVLITVQCLNEKFEMNPETFEETVHITHSGIKLRKELIKSSLSGIPENEWNNYLLEAHGNGKNITLVSSSLVHKLSNAVHQKHKVGNTESNDKNYLQVFLDETQLHNYSFSYFSHTSEKVRVLTDKYGRMFSGLFNESMLIPLAGTDNDSSPRFFIIENNVKNVIEYQDTERSMEAPLIRRGLNTDCKPGTDPLVIEMAIAFDSTLCNFFRGNKDYTFAAAADNMEMAMIPFHRQTCLLHKIRHMSGYCDSKKDRYKNPGRDPLENLRDGWQPANNPIQLQNFDVVYLMIQNSDFGWGDSDFNSICTEDKFAWSRLNDGSSQVSKNLAHILGASYRPRFRFPFESSNIYGDIMIQAFNQAKRFNSESLIEISETIRRQGQCLKYGSAVEKHNVLSDNTYTCKFEYRDRNDGNSYKSINVGWLGIGRNYVLVGGVEVPIAGIIRHGQFQFTIRLSIEKEGYGIEKYTRHVNMFGLSPPNKTNWGPTIEVFKENVFSFTGATKIRTSWKWSEIAKPKEWPGCCGRRMTMYFTLWICKNGDKRCTKVNTVYSLDKVRCAVG